MNLTCEEMFELAQITKDELKSHQGLREEELIEDVVQKRMRQIRQKQGSEANLDKEGEEDTTSEIYRKKAVEWFNKRKMQHQEKSR